jgi:hypothetical protein
MGPVTAWWLLRAGFTEADRQGREADRGPSIPRTALPHPPSTSQKVPINSAPSFLVGGMSDSCLFDLLVFLVHEDLVHRIFDGKLPESPAEVKLKPGISVHTQ